MLRTIMSGLRRGFADFSGIGRFNHVAIAVPNLQAATAHYRDSLGAEVSPPVDIEEHGVTVVFVNLPNTKIELVHPLGKDSPIAGFLKKNPDGGMHHICLEVENIFDAKDHVESLGVRLLTPEPKIGAHGKSILFLHPKDCGGVLTELEEI